MRTSIIKLGLSITFLMAFYLSSDAARLIRYYYDGSGNRTARLLVFVVDPDEIFAGKTASSEEEVVDTFITSHDVKVYPNPAAAFVHVEPGTFSGEGSSMQLLSHSGSVLLDMQALETNIELRIDQYAPGTYHLVLFKNGNRKHLRFIKY